MPMYIVLASTPKWFRAWPAIACALAIFWLSVIKAPSLQLAEHWFWDNIDKVGHAIAYASLCITSCWSFRQIFDKQTPSIRQIQILSSFCFLYGLSIEILQHFLPHRSFDPFDMLANAVGIVIGAMFFARLFR